MSVGQYVSSQIERQLGLLSRIACNKFRPLVISLDPQVGYFEFRAQLQESDTNA